MSSYEVDGVTLPDPVAGHPALDFCNTRAGWNAEQRREYLIDPGVLAVWAGEAGLIRAEDADQLRKSVGSAEAGKVLRRTVAFREALYPVFLGQGTRSDWEVVSAEASLARSRARLVPRFEEGSPDRFWPDLEVNAPIQDAPSPGEAALERPLPRATPRTAPAYWHLPYSGSDTALSAVAAAAADFLTTPRPGIVAACPGEGCGWLFTDPRGRRRWCSMAVCGNRAKARRHRQGG